MPSEPVLVTTWGVVRTSGCPGRPPRRRSWWIRSKSSLPSAISSAYSAGASWPLEEK